MRWVALALLVAAPTARADVDPCACSPNKPGFHRAAQLTGDWGGVRKDLYDDGVEVKATYAGEVFGARGLHDEAVFAGLAALAIDGDLSELVDDHLGAFHIAGFAIHGEGLSADLMEVMGVSNNVANEEVRLFEAWLEQPIGPLTLRAGLLAADQEFDLAEHGSVLIGATFGIIAMFSYNIGAPVYPVATPGVSARVEKDDFTARAAIYAGEPDDKYGIPRGLADDALIFVEGQYKFLQLGMWHHTERGNGYYGVLDHQLGRYVGAFTRVAVARDAPIWFYTDAGIRIGPGPLRPRDFASVGMAFARTELGAQTIAEATYQILVTKWLTVQPDLQAVLTRTGTHGVVATRVVIAF